MGDLKLFFGIYITEHIVWEHYDISGLKRLNPNSPLSLLFSLCQHRPWARAPLSRTREEGVFAVGFAARLSHWAWCSWGMAGHCWQRLGGVTPLAPSSVVVGVAWHGEGFEFCVGCSGGPGQSVGRGVTLWACIWELHLETQAGVLGWTGAGRNQEQTSADPSPVSGPWGILSTWYFWRGDLNQLTHLLSVWKNDQVVIGP